jgi:hypothetical protein
VITFLLLAAPAHAQDAAAPTATQPPDAANPLPHGNPADAPQPNWFREVKATYTFLPGGTTDGLQINDVELSTTLAAALPGDLAPVLFTPGLGGHWWDGPAAERLPPGVDLPTHVYDAYLDIGWRPRLARWLFVDLGVTPGLYTDLRDVPAEAFQMRGRGVAIVAFSEQLQVVAGALYVNRNKTKVLPAGGVIWNPDEDTKLSMVFPAPKLSRRIFTARDVPWWVYLAGEFGGGRWAVERADGASDSIDYTDVRVILGLEWTVPHGLKGHLETGYVFGRRVNFSSDTPDFHPRDTWMVRAGISY